MLRGPGSMVHAGTLNVGSAVLRVRTTAAAADTAVARMAALVEAAASQQSPAEALVAQVRCIGPQFHRPLRHCTVRYAW